MMRNAEQWHFIGTVFRDGAIFWVVMVAYAAIHDLFISTMSRTDQSLMPGASLSISRIVYTIHWKRSRLGHKYRDRNILTVLDVIRVALNVIACIVYVIGTYRRTVFGPIRAINAVLAVVFLIDICFGITLADSALRDVISLRVVCDALSIPSLFYASGRVAYLNFGFLRAYVAYCNYCSVNRRLGLSFISSYHFSALLLVKSLTLVYILASGVQLFEVPGDIFSPTVVATWAEENSWHFFNSFYFTIVTLATVGYGDITPETLLGRLFTIFMILLGIIVFSNIIGQIVEHVRYKRGSGAFVKRVNSRHVIVSGRPQLADIVRFTSEFYARSRLSSATAKVVVLVPNPMWTDEEWSQEVTRNEFLRRRVSFLVGNVRNRDDLHRVRIESADALFLVVSPFGLVDPSDIDAATVLDALAVRNVRTDIAIYSIVLLKASLFQVHDAQSLAVSSDPDLLFRKHMRGSAQHAGLLEDIFLMESNSVPRELQSHVIGKAKASGLQIPLKEQSGHSRLQIVRAWVKGEMADQSGSKVSREAKKANDVNKTDSKISNAEQSKNGRTHRWYSGRMREPCHDLGRSTAMCLQDINAALISAHIKANGVGTLITNMMLEIEVVVHPEEPAWLKEYQLGAVCHLIPLVIPHELHGVRIADAAVTLFDYGLILLTLTADPENSSPDLVLSLDRVLGAGFVGFFLTYHSRRFAYAALLLAAIAIGSCKIQPEVESAEAVETDLPSEVPLSTGTANVAFQTTSKVDTGDKWNGPRSAIESERSAIWSRPRRTQFNSHFCDSSEDEDDGVELSGSGSEGEVRADGTYTGIKHDLRWLSASESMHEVVRRDAYRSRCLNCSMARGSGPGDKSLEVTTCFVDSDVPREVKRHIILVGSGDLMLRQLPLLLKYIWRDSSHPLWRDWRYLHRGRIPVVVIHPCISDRLRLIFRKQERKSLFFVQGSSSSRQTWQRAKLSAAKGVVVLADYAETWERADARTIFSTMTLDSFIKDSQDVFVVSELIEEKSLQYLREPRRRRRIGVDDLCDEATYHVKRPGMILNWDTLTGARTHDGRSGFHLPDDCISDHIPESQNHGVIQRSGPVVASNHDSKAPVDETILEEMEKAIDIEKSGVVSPLTRGLSAFLKQRSGFEDDKGMRPETKFARRQSAAVREESRPYSLGAASRYADTAEDIGGDVRPGVHQALRGTLFSRSSYASGDLLLRSAALNILVREYMEPGIVHLYKELVGAGAKRLGGLKIRLVRISRSILDSARSGTNLTGGRAVEYQEVFVQLVAMGVTPLGLYRSGGAPVRIPMRSRLRRGADYERECVRVVKEQAHRRARNDSAMEEGNEKIRLREAADEASRCSLPVEHESEPLTSSVVARPESMRRGDIEGEARGTIPAGTGETGREPGRVRKDAAEDAINDSQNSARVNLEAVSAESGNYEEYREPDNRLPYVLTLPEPYSLVSERDGVYILCHPDFQLPLDWSEGYAQGLRHSGSGMLG